MEAAEGGGAEPKQRWEEKGEDAEKEKCEKIGAREAKVSLRGWTDLASCASVCSCTCACVIRGLSVCAGADVCVCWVLLRMCASRQEQNVIELVGKWEKEEEEEIKLTRERVEDNFQPLPLSSLHRSASAA